MIPHIHFRCAALFFVILSFTLGFNPGAFSQETSPSRQLERVEVEPPVQSVTSRGGDSGQVYKIYRIINRNGRGEDGARRLRGARCW